MNVIYLFLQSSLLENRETVTARYLNQKSMRMYWGEVYCISSSTFGFRGIIYNFISWIVFVHVSSNGLN